MTRPLPRPLTLPTLPRRRLLGSLALLAWPLASHAGFNLFTSTYTLSQDDLQARLAARFPIKRGAAELAGIELTAPVLSLDAGQNRVRVTTRLSLSNAILKPQRTEGVLNFSSTLVYDAATRALLLHEPRVERIDLDVLSESGAEWLTRLGGKLAAELLQGQVLYAFKPEQFQWGPMRYTPVEFKVVDGGIAIKLD